MTGEPLKTIHGAGYVCGVDIGTTYATFCLLPADAVAPPAFAILRTVKTWMGSGPEGNRSLGLKAKGDLARWSPLIRHVRLERPMGRHVRSVANLSSVKGALSMIWDWETSIDEIQPNEWKQACGLPGNAAKDRYVEWVREQLWPVVPSEHEAAAYGVAVSIVLDSAKAAAV